MRKLNWDLLQLQKGSRDGSHGTRRERSYALAQMASTLHEEGYRGLRARNLKGRHVEALVREWFRRGLSHAIMNPSWSVQKTFCTNMLRDKRSIRLPLPFARGVDALASSVHPGIQESQGQKVWAVARSTVQGTSVLPSRGAEHPTTRV